MRIPAWLRSRYCALEPWWTRWCEGVLNTASNQRGRRRTFSVWIQNWYSRLHDCASRIIHGSKPASASGAQNGRPVIGVHVWRSAVERL
jgi:hypothetical protein